MMRHLVVLVSLVLVLSFIQTVSAASGSGGKRKDKGTKRPRGRPTQIEYSEEERKAAQDFVRERFAAEINPEPISEEKARENAEIQEHVTRRLARLQETGVSQIFGPRSVGAPADLTSSIYQTEQNPFINIHGDSGSINPNMFWTEYTYLKHPPFTVAPPQASSSETSGKTKTIHDFDLNEPGSPGPDPQE